MNSGNACCLSVQNLSSSSWLSKNLRTKNRTIILSIVFYGCETWSLILREERRLCVSENRALKKKFGPKRDQVTGEWRRLRHEEIYDLYFFTIYYSGDQIEKNELDRACSKYGKRRGADRILVGKSDGKRPLGKPRFRWMILKRIFKKWDEGHGLN